MPCCINAIVFNQKFDDTNHVAGSGLNVIQRNPVPKNINATVISTEILNPAKIIKLCANIFCLVFSDIPLLLYQIKKLLTVKNIALVISQWI